MLKFKPGWNEAGRDHALNIEAAVRGLFDKLKIERGDKDWASKVAGFVKNPKVEVLVYKGFHQDLSLIHISEPTRPY